MGLNHGKNVERRRRKEQTSGGSEDARIPKPHEKTDAGGERNHSANSNSRPPNAQIRLAAKSHRAKRNQVRNGIRQEETCTSGIDACSHSLPNVVNTPRVGSINDGSQSVGGSSQKRARTFQRSATRTMVVPSHAPRLASPRRGVGPRSGRRRQRSAVSAFVATCFQTVRGAGRQFDGRSREADACRCHLPRRGWARVVPATATASRSVVLRRAQSHCPHKRKLCGAHASEVFRAGGLPGALSRAETPTPLALSQPVHGIRHIPTNNHA
ncbi:MAG: hypothetical protein JWM32_416 [Verrucomicrobia bacterium]|nr:hypothetical protein [Verrucomicrobiota bacterium]